MGGRPGTRPGLPLFLWGDPQHVTRPLHGSFPRSYPERGHMKVV